MIKLVVSHYRRSNNKFVTGPEVQSQQQSMLQLPNQPNTDVGSKDQKKPQQLTVSDDVAIVIDEKLPLISKSDQVITIYTVSYL